MPSRVVSSTLAAVLLLACSKAEQPAVPDAARSQTPGAKTLIDAAAQPGSEAGTRTASADAGPSAEFVGVVRGTVTLKAKAKLPLAPPILGAEGSKPISTPPCPPVDLYDRRTVQANETNQGLSPVHVAITGMTAVPTREPRVYEISIDACRMRPTLLGAMRGDTIRLSNRSEATFLPMLPGDRFMRGLMPREAREFVTKRLGPTPLSCGFASYCGESSVITLSHPLYAVTDAQGSFTIERVPLDQKLTLHAWHPLFEVTSVEFELSASEPDKRVSIELAPSPPAADKKGAAKPAPAKGKGSP
jgi:hypothetical protein